MSLRDDEVVALFMRPDFQAVGVVFVDPRDPGATTTLWQLPDRCDPSELEAHRCRTRQVPGAIVYVFDRGVETHLNHDWRDVAWLKTYVADLVQTITDAGSFEAFFAALEFPARN